MQSHTTEGVDTGRVENHVCLYSYSISLEATPGMDFVYALSYLFIYKVCVCVGVCVCIYIYIVD